MTVSNPSKRRWDPLVKITHWGVAIMVICNAVVVGEGSIAHIYAGYTLAALLGLRLLWGFVGPQSARFASFPPNPLRAIAHVKDILAGRREEHVSHNPLGALMAYALWAGLAVIVASGIAMAGAPPTIPPSATASQLVSEREDGEAEERASFRYGADREDDEYGEEEGESEELFEEVHEAAVNLLYLLILLHIVGVAFETVRSGRRTFTAMLPGGK